MQFTTPLELLHLWKEVDYSHEDQAYFLDKVKNTIQNQFNEELYKQQKVKDELARTINEELQRSRALCTILDLTPQFISADSLVSHSQLLKSYNDQLERLKSERTIEKEGIYKEIQSVCFELGQQEPEKPNVSTLSILAIKSLNETLSALNDVKKRRQSEIVAIAEQIFFIFNELGENNLSSSSITHDYPSAYSSQTIDNYLWNPQSFSKIPLTQDFLVAIQHRRDILVTEKQHRIRQIEELCGQISHLYERLDISYKERENISPSSWTFNPTKEKIRTLTNLYEKLEFRKKLVIKEFVVKARRELSMLHQELHIIGDSIDDSDDNMLLEKLEHEIRKLKACKEEFDKIIVFVNKREDLLEDMAEIERTKGDSSRYSDFKRLNREEKVRKDAMKLPDQTSQLKKIIQDFELKYSILVRNKKGEAYIGVIMEYESNLALEKSKKGAKKIDYKLNQTMNTTLNTTINTPLKSRVIPPKSTPGSRTMYTPGNKLTSTRTAHVMEQSNPSSDIKRKPFKQLKL